MGLKGLIRVPDEQFLEEKRKTCKIERVLNKNKPECKDGEKHEL